MLARLTMVTLRRAQIEAMADAAFLRRLVGHLQLQSQFSPIAPIELRARVDRAVRRARRYGLTWELTIADYAERDLTFGERFDEEPAVAAALGHVVACPCPDVAYTRLGHLV